MRAIGGFSPAGQNGSAGLGALSADAAGGYGGGVPGGAGGAYADHSPDAAAQHLRSGRSIYDLALDVAAGPAGIMTIRWSGRRWGAVWG